MVIFTECLGSRLGNPETIQKRGSGKLGFAAAGFTWTYNSDLADVESIADHGSSNGREPH